MADIVYLLLPIFLGILRRFYSVSWEIRKEAIPLRNYPPVMEVKKIIFCFLWIVFTCGFLFPVNEFYLFIDLLSERMKLAGIYLILGFIGYSFVSVVTLRRPNPFLSRYGNCFEVFRLCSILSLLSCFGPVSLFSFSFYQIFYFVMLFFLGLHFTYLDNNATLQSLGCKFPIPKRWKTFWIDEIFALFIIVILICIVLVELLPTTVAFKSYFLIFYELFLFIFSAIIFSGSSPFSGFFHFHHYLLPLLLFPMCHDNFVSVACTSAGLGILVEGIAVWGMDPLWVNDLPKYNH